MTASKLKSAYSAFAGKIILPALLCVMPVVAGPAFAHHSTAMYNYGVKKEIVGTIRQFQWTNPHSFIQILVPDGRGGTQEWSIECGAITTMSMTGWTRDSIKRGDKVSISIAPLRDGSNGGTLRHLTLANGKVLHGAADNFKSDAAGRPSGIDLPTLSRVPAKPR